jgi:hypothetical protein
MVANEILQQLNEYHRCPSLDAVFPIDVRLSLYGNDEKWAIYMEMLSFCQQRIGHEACMTRSYCFGNDFPPSGGTHYSELHVTKDGPSGRLFDSTDFMQHHVSLTAMDVTVRGKVLPITTDPAEYEAAGIKLEHPVAGPCLSPDCPARRRGAGQQIMGYELLRLIVPRHRRLFFATETEIIERVGEPMPLLLRLNEWYHPDGIVEERLGQSETFQLIADVIANDAPTLYQPTVPPNTHWSNWPMAGTI